MGPNVAPLPPSFPGRWAFRRLPPLSRARFRSSCEEVLGVKRFTAALVPLIVLPFLSAPSLGGTIHVPEDMQGIAYGRLADIQPTAVGVQSNNPLDNWHLVNPVVEGGNITAIAVGNGVVVALVQTSNNYAKIIVAKVVAAGGELDWYTKALLRGGKTECIGIRPRTRSQRGALRRGGPGHDPVFRRWAELGPGVLGRRRSDLRCQRGQEARDRGKCLRCGRPWQARS